MLGEETMSNIARAEDNYLFKDSDGKKIYKSTATKAQLIIAYDDVRAANARLCNEKIQLAGELDAATSKIINLLNFIADTYGEEAVKQAFENLSKLSHQQSRNS